MLQRAREVQSRFGRVEARSKVKAWDQPKYDRSEGREAKGSAKGTEREGSRLIFAIGEMLDPRRPGEMCRERTKESDSGQSNTAAMNGDASDGDSEVKNRDGEGE